MIVAKFMAALTIGYLLGAIPFGLLVARHMAAVDVRQHGSGKTGTTNVLRVAGRKAAALVMLLDILKGALAVTFAGLIFKGGYEVVIGSNSWWLIRSAQVAAALAAMAGHNWSVFLGFRGGRGVATFFGGLVALYPVAALFAGEVTVVGAVLTRFASVGSIAGAVSTYTVLVPLTLLDGFPIEYLAYAFIGTVAIIVMHRDNIARLFAGTERKLGEKAEKIVPPPSKKSAG